jgi:3-dehydroquinate synthetase
MLLCCELTMPDVPDIPRPSQLWKRLSLERKQLAADAFWQDENAAAEQAEAVVLIAQRIKFRVRSVQTLPREKKSRHLLNLGAVSEMVAARLLVAYHLHHQRAMMAAFLDALGITHEDGVIADQELQRPSTDRLRDAARAIGAAHPADDVALYLSTLMWQDPETWAGLAELPELAQPTSKADA